MDSYYKVQEFANMAGVTERTLRYYDKIELLVPSHKNEAMHRFYTDDDFKKLKKITALKFLGFSIAEIKEYDLDDVERTSEVIANQQKVIDLKIKHLKIIKESLNAIDNTLRSSDRVDWDMLLDEVKNIRINKHKKRDGINPDIDESYRKRHHNMMMLLAEFTKARGEKRKVEIVKEIESNVNNMEDIENGLDNLLQVLEEVDVIPEELRGVNPKDIENLIGFINKYKSEESFE
ncbi:MerR family transcriptional regulator [uncultured Clostridium sp.]|uniref:MerR family transcriptional regulator n=1 Tax=uncultured Clostridium sp. TaxID=59620 RepID=UPI002613FAC4|nr:MerR family transcriptional regulator [uncultured Clostridium sp.]